MGEFFGYQAAATFGRKQNTLSIHSKAQLS